MKDQWTLAKESLLEDLIDWELEDKNILEFTSYCYRKDDDEFAYDLQCTPIVLTCKEFKESDFYNEYHELTNYETEGRPIVINCHAGKGMWSNVSFEVN